MIIPSWFLVVNQQEILNGGLGLIGLDNYLINSIHFFVLYYVLFGVLPAFVYRKMGLFTLEFKVTTFIPQKII